MTREEAIKWLGYHKQGEEGKAVEALDMAIKALEQEPIDKTFTKAYSDAIVKAINAHWELIIDEIRSEIKQLPDMDAAGVFSSVRMKRMVLDILDKYKAESEDKK